MRKSKTKFFIGLIVVIAVLSLSVFGGYLMIDKFLVPKYFSAYGINSLSELVGIVQTIYIVPDEEEFIINPHTDFDITNAKNKLVLAGFPTLADGGMDYEAIAKKDYTRTPDETFVDNFILLSDKEVAAIADEILSSGILVSNYPDLSYINTLNMEIKQVSITPAKTNVTINEYDEESLDPNSTIKTIISTTTDANLSVTIKIDTESARKQISTNLNMPLFLIDWIIPDTMYITSTLDTYIDSETGERAYKNATLSINSKTAKQSEVLLKLLISFIFPDETFTIEAFSSQLGALAIDGMNVLGDMKFASLKSSSSKTPVYGIKITL